MYVLHEIVDSYFSLPWLSNSLSPVARMNILSHRGWVTHICVGNLAIIGSDNDLSPVRRQAITWNNAGILLNGPLGTNFSKILIEVHEFALKNAFETIDCEMAGISMC